MWRLRFSLRVFGALGLLAIALGSDPVTRGADKDTPKPVSGILTDTNAKWIKVKGDGDEEPVKYTVGDAEKKMLKGIFTVCRVQVAYKLDGDTRQLVSIKKLQTRGTGTVTGEVLAVYNNFWVEVKPKNGPPDGYALGAPPDKAKAIVDVLKELKKGDIVTIRFISDLERHRIQTLTKVAPKGK